MGPKTGQNVLEASHNDCQTPRRPLDKAYLQLESSDLEQAERAPEARKTVQEMGRRHRRILTTSQNQQNKNDLTIDTTWLTTAQDGSKWDSLELDFVSSRLKHPKDSRSRSPRLRQPNQQQPHTQHTLHTVHLLPTNWELTTQNQQLGAPATLLK